MENKSLFSGIHHSSLIVEDLDKSLQFYCDFLGLQKDPQRPEMAYKGAWLNVGSQQIHLLNLNKTEQCVHQPEHVGRDRHTALHINDISQLQNVLQAHKVPFTMSSSGRQALFCRDPDGNGLEFIQL